MKNDDTKKTKQVSVRCEGDILERLEALAAAKPVGTVSSFAYEALKRGLPLIEKEYLGEMPSAAKTRKAA